MKDKDVLDMIEDLLVNNFADVEVTGSEAVELLERVLVFVYGREQLADIKENKAEQERRDRKNELYGPQ